MPHSWLRFARRALGPIVALGSLGLAVSPTRAQVPQAEPYSPARFISSQDLVFYAEFDGLDAHADAWRQTVACRVLNETPTGVMLEEIFGQLFKKLPAASMFSSLTASERSLLIKHIAKSGFTCGVNIAGKNEGAIVFSFHGAFSNKEVRSIFARLLQQLPGAGAKSPTVVKSGHKMVTGHQESKYFFWWVEETKKEDLLLILGPAGADDYVLDTAAGKKPSMLTSPLRSDLTSRTDGFERTGVMLLDLAAFAGVSKRVDPADKRLDGFIDQFNVKRIDFQGGFQGDALMTVTRFHPADPSKGGGQSSVGFPKETIPNIPPGALGLMVLAYDLKSIPAKLHGLPALAPLYDQLVTTLKEKTKVRLEEDILAQLGPKITTYVAPAKPGGSTAPALPNALNLLTRVGAGGTDALPKVALLIDVANPTAFGKSLDEIMVYVNRQLRTSFAPPARPGADEAPPPGRGRGRAPAGPAPEFRVMSGETKSYGFMVPPELSAAFPAGFRPTIRVGPKQVALAISADVARQSLEAKGTYAPPAEIASAFGRLPSKLNWLMVVDPRDFIPEILAGFPAKLQAGINTLNTPISAPAPAPGAGPDTAASRSTPRINKQAMIDNTSEVASPTATAAPPPPAADTKSAAPGMLVLQVDPSKLPTADAIRKLLFPAIYTVDSEGGTIRFTTREAFPLIPDPSLVGLIIRAVRMRQNAAGTAGVRRASAPTPPGMTTPAPPSGTQRAPR